MTGWFYVLKPEIRWMFIDVYFFSFLLKLLLRIRKISGGGANTRLGCCH